MTMPRRTQIPRTPASDSTQWRIPQADWSSLPNARQRRISRARQVGVAMCVLAPLGYWLGQINLTGLCVFLVCATIPIVLAQLFARADKIVHWQSVEARCLDREARAVVLDGGKVAWEIRLRCEFLYNGELHNTIPWTATYHFPDEAAALAFLAERIGDSGELSVMINPRNPLQALL